MIMLAALLSTAVVSAQSPMGDPARANRDVQTLVGFGPRVAGSPALENAANYLIAEYKKAGFDAKIQPFTYPRLSDVGSSISVAGTTFTANAIVNPSIADIEAPLVSVPNLGTRNDYAKLDVRSKIAIVKRGSITFLEKARAAQNAGAVGAIIYNSVPGNFAPPILGEFSIPIVVISGADGAKLLEQLGKQQLKARVRTGVKRINVAGKNVVARMANANTPSLILGAHFDSVPGSPGANDNAGGTAAILEIARRLPKNLVDQVWFVSFDGEEDGLHGSRAFVDQSPNDLLDNLKGMLNFDMVGINDKLSLGGSSQIVEAALSVTPNLGRFPARSDSDHASFAAEGVPNVFFYRGDDPNYHLPSDVSVNPLALEDTVTVGLATTQKLLERIKP
jgi:aminopeptidase YwaD